MEVVVAESQTQICRARAPFLLSFLHFPLASTFAQLLLGFERGGWGNGRVMVVLLGSTQWGAEKQVADPGFDEGEGRAMRVSGSHHNLRGEETSESFMQLRGCQDSKV